MRRRWWRTFLIILPARSSNWACSAHHKIVLEHARFAHDARDQRTMAVSCSVNTACCCQTTVMCCCHVRFQWLIAVWRLDTAGTSLISYQCNKVVRTWRSSHICCTNLLAILSLSTASLKFLQHLKLEHVDRFLQTSPT